MSYESYAIFQQQKRAHDEGNKEKRMDMDARELAQEWISKAGTVPEPGDIVDRGQLAKQLRTAHRGISDRQIAAVAREIEIHIHPEFTPPEGMVYRIVKNCQGETQYELFAVPYRSPSLDNPQVAVTYPRVAYWEIDKSERLPDGSYYAEWIYEGEASGVTSLYVAPYIGAAY